MPRPGVMAARFGVSYQPVYRPLYAGRVGGSLDPRRYRRLRRRRRSVFDLLRALGQGKVGLPAQRLGGGVGRYAVSGFRARYPGTCDDCGGPIVPGDRVGYNAVQELVHWDCPPEPPAVRSGEERCPVCFLAHPAGECDR